MKIYRREMGWLEGEAEGELYKKIVRQKNLMEEAEKNVTDENPRSYIAYKILRQRYEALIRLNPKQFAEMMDRDCSFDDQLDNLIAIEEKCK